MTLLAAKWVMFFSDRKFARRQNHLHFSVNKISPATQRIAPILQALQSVQLSFFSEGAKAKQTIIANLRWAMKAMKPTLGGIVLEVSWLKPGLSGWILKIYGDSCQFLINYHINVEKLLYRAFALGKLHDAIKCFDKQWHVIPYE